jgi:hypothetical protein
MTPSVVAARSSVESEFGRIETVRAVRSWPADNSAETLM